MCISEASQYTILEHSLLALSLVAPLFHLTDTSPLAQSITLPRTLPMRMLSTQNRLQFGENAIFAICISGCLWLFFFNFVLLKKYYYLLYCIIFTHALNTEYSQWQRNSIYLQKSPLLAYFTTGSVGLPGIIYSPHQS